MMKRLVFLNRFFYPDHSATSQILSDLAFQLAASGREVHVITSQQLYDRPRAPLAAAEIVNGVHVHRVATTRFGRSALLGRGIDYASYYGAMWRSACSLVDRGDVLIAKTDPPLTSVVAMRVAMRREARLVNWLQDIYPEIATQLGMPFLKGPASQGLSYLRDVSFKRAAANVLVGDRMAERVRLRGIPSDRVHVIPNWSDDEEICPVSHADNPLRRAWGLEDKFVVGYSGNLGRAHEFNSILSAAERLRDHPRILFVLIGGGHQFDQLAHRVEKRGLQQMFRFMPYQGQALLKYSLNVPDVHWLSLKPELEGLMVPSKFYGIAAAGRPVISISAIDGEIARLVRHHECGLVIEPGNGQALAEALVLLSRDPERVAQMGRRARAMLDGHFTRKQAFARWQNLFETLAKSTARGTDVRVGRS